MTVLSMAHKRRLITSPNNVILQRRFVTSLGIFLTSFYNVVFKFLHDVVLKRSFTIFMFIINNYIANDHRFGKVRFGLFGSGHHHFSNFLTNRGSMQRPPVGERRLHRGLQLQGPLRLRVLGHLPLQSWWHCHKNLGSFGTVALAKCAAVLVPVLWFKALEETMALLANGLRKAPIDKH